MNRLNLDQLSTFKNVIELGSFSAAADRLNLSQPAVSLQIRQLEARLGTALIERIGRKAQPTAAGAELLAHAARIDAAVSAALDAVTAYRGDAQARLRLGTGETACIFLLPPILKDLRRRFPQLEIIVTTGNTDDILPAVEDNRLDIGFVTMPAAGRALETTPVMDDEFVIVAPPAMELPKRLTPEALGKLPVMLFEPAGNTRRLVDEWFARSNAVLRPVMSLGSVEALKEFVDAGLGCAILPRMALGDSVTHKTLIAHKPFAIRSLSPALYRKLAIIVRRDKPLHRGLKQLIAALKALK